MVEMALDISTMIKASWETVEEKTPMFLNHNWKASRVKGENLKNRNKTRRRNKRRKRRREKEEEGEVERGRRKRRRRNIIKEFRGFRGSKRPWK